MGILRTQFRPGQPSILQLEGEIDLSTAAQLHTALEEALSSDPAAMIDMAGVTFCDAAGLRVILKVADSLDGAAPLKLLNARRAVWLLELVGLTDLPSIAIWDGGDLSGR